MAKNPLVIICGPTATGKTALGIKLAKEFTGEIISADSRQVYRGMDIGTGKDIKNFKFQISNFKLTEEKIGYYFKNRTKIWGLDLVKPNQKFSVSHWVRFANLVIEDIWKREKLPIIVGGTGFYLKGLLQGFETLGIPPDWELRKELSNYPIIKLANLLKKLDPERWRRMNKSDRNNPRRLVRAIEIAKQYQKLNIKKQRYPSASSGSRAKSRDILNIKNVLMIGVKADYKTFYQRIDRRVEERVKQGIIEEIKGLLKKGYHWDNSALGTTIGYKEWRPYIESSKFKVESQKLKDEVVQRWKYDEHAYARRQMSWFRSQKDINWFDITKKGWQNKVIKQVSKWAYDRKN